jgi:hypothetical protein
VNKLCIFEHETSFSILFGLFNFLMMLSCIMLFKRSFRKIDSITKPGVADPPDKTYCIITLQLVKVVQVMLVIMAADQLIYCLSFWIDKYY